MTGNVLGQAITEDWNKQFISDEHGFRANFPVLPKQTSQGKDSVTFVAKTLDSEYSIQILKFSKTAIAQTSKEKLMQATEDKIIVLGATVIDQRKSLPSRSDTLYALNNIPVKKYQIINQFLFWRSRRTRSRIRVLPVAIDNG